MTKSDLLVSQIILDELPFVVGSFSNVCQFILKKIKNQEGSIILPCSLNDIANRSQSFLVDQAYKKVDICTQDGMPLVWWAKWKNKVLAERVYGPDLMQYILTKVDPEKRHCFYGATEQTLFCLKKTLIKENRNIQRAMFIIAPFSVIGTNEYDSDLETIKKGHPDILWIGISSPKQVWLAARWKEHLPNTVIFCVGAAFDLVSGVKSQAPKWIQDLGFEWGYRLITEPKRLWRRYLIGIPYYLLRCLLQRLFFT